MRKSEITAIIREHRANRVNTLTEKIAKLQAELDAINSSEDTLESFNDALDYYDEDNKAYARKLLRVAYPGTYTSWNGAEYSGSGSEIYVIHHGSGWRNSEMKKYDHHLERLHLPFNLIGHCA